MKINVTQDHIDRGVRQNECFCAVAIAIHEAIGNSCHVNHYDIYIHSPESTMTRDCGTSYQVDPSLKEWLEQFDRNQPVEPFLLRFSEHVAFVDGG